MAPFNPLFDALSERRFWNMPGMLGSASLRDANATDSGTGHGSPFAMARSDSTRLTGAQDSETESMLLTSVPHRAEHEGMEARHLIGAIA